MVKVKRYFQEDDKTEPSKTLITEPDPGDTIVYNARLPKPAWGRRKEDERIKKFVNNSKQKFPGRVPIPEHVKRRHSRGEGMSVDGIRTNVHKKRMETSEKRFKYSNNLAARAEILLTEDFGSLEAEEGETTRQYTQQQIKKNVDIASAAKAFDLKLNFGPYRAKFTRNGRHLLLGGKLGHVAAFDWITKRLHCELNVMESVHDVSWLHLETMFAVAQKGWVYIYDNQGIELHCIKKLNKISKMEFLPYHFLLGTASDEGYLSWLDISIGQLVSQYNARLGKLNLLTHNPYNAVLCCGHSKGIVSMWSPTVKEPLVKMLCHKAPLSALHVDPKGLYMATAAVNREVKIWDVRMLGKEVQKYIVSAPVNNLSLSQQLMLAVSVGNVVDVYRDCCATTAKKPYLRHRFDTAVGNMQFCPFEDVLGVGTGKGYISLLVPGCGEPNFDAFEANPYQKKSQRREFEVKALLEKIQPEFITLDPTRIAEVDVPTMKEKIELRQTLMNIKPPKVEYKHRNKMKGKGGVAMARNKKIVQEQAKKEFLKNMKELKATDGGDDAEKKKPTRKKDVGVFDRFLPKK